MHKLCTCPHTICIDITATHIWHAVLLTKSHCSAWPRNTWIIFWYIAGFIWHMVLMQMPCSPWLCGTWWAQLPQTQVCFQHSTDCSNPASLPSLHWTCCWTQSWTALKTMHRVSWESVMHSPSVTISCTTCQAKSTGAPWCLMPCLHLPIPFIDVKAALQCQTASMLTWWSQQYLMQ